jgi:curved DNA-binding protein CbpA
MEKAKALKKAMNILELTSPLSLIDIKNAYKTLAKRYHPDRNPQDSNTGKKMKQLNWAYQMLLSDFESIKIPLSMLLSETLSDEERIKQKFYYDWMPPHHGDNKKAKM